LIYGHLVLHFINVQLVCFTYVSKIFLFGIILGELPFQPFAGTRKDRAVMKRILDTKPTGCISGVENTPGGEIQWSKTLPPSCRLSSSLKHRLELLLQRLLESERSKLMTFREFFIETGRLLTLTPIYYLNLKRFKLSCGYFEATQSITKLYDELHHQNEDENNEEYYCLFQKYKNSFIFHSIIIISCLLVYPIQYRKQNQCQ
jgi:hypothetical protein